MLKNINETILKVTIITAMLGALITLYITGLHFYSGEYTTFDLALHQTTAVGIIILLISHGWLRRCQIRKLKEEFIAVLFNKQIKHQDNKEKLLKSIKDLSLEELCEQFNFDSDVMVEKLKIQHVHVNDTNKTIRKISKENKKDMYQVFLLMASLHTEGLKV